MAKQSGFFQGDQNFPVPFHMNYGALFLDTILKFENKIALINGATHEQITYHDLAQQILNTASSLTSRGLQPRDVVAICSENRIEYIVTAIAVLCAGGTLTFINSAYSRDEVVHVANISNPKYVFFSNAAFEIHYETFKNLNSTIKEFFIYEASVLSTNKAISFEKLSKASIDMNSFKPINFQGWTQTALILYSSGTTGLPKGVQLSHLNLIVTVFQEKTSYTKDLSVLTVTPFCNTMGIFCVTDALIIRKTVVFLPRFNEKIYLETIEKYKVGILVVAPPIVVILCKSAILKDHDVSSVEVINCGGAPLDPDVIQATKMRFPRLLYILQGYGMTETTGVLTRETETTFKQGSVGKVAAGIILKVVDLESGRVVRPGERGEVCVKGPALFSGYIGKPLQNDLDEESFFRTGDIAYYDDNGFFYIVDRLKELIKYKAWQVPPSELEAVLLQHPSVKDVGVVGAPNPEAGELPTAFVVKKPDSNVTEKELIEFVASKVSPWKRLRGGVRFVHEIPKNGSGKILRRILRASLAKPPASKL